MATQRSLSRRIEIGGLALVLAALAFFLLRFYDVKAWSDPLQWYVFGRDFAQGFGTRQLAYGFPLLVAGAIALVGPVEAWLVNVPVLLLLTGLLYALARTVGGAASPLGARLAPLAGAVAVALWIRIDSELLLHLTNPYRDPLAFALMLSSCLLLIRFRNAPGRSLIWVAGSGACLALACSTRPTAALMLLPMAIYGGVARLREPARPFLRPLLAFCAAFAVAAAPLLVHNAQVSGSPIVPAQAAETFEETGDVVPGVRVRNVDETLPETLRYLGAHYGWGAGLLALAGLLAAWRERNEPILCLCLPGALAYTLFYGGYGYVVDRYLMVVDLFVLSVAGAGAAALLRIVLTPLPEGARAATATALGLAALALPAAAALTAPPVADERFQLPEVRALQRHVGALVPEGSVILGERPIGEVMRCFLEPRARVFVAYGVGADALGPDKLEQIREIVASEGEIYAIRHSDQFLRLVRDEFDVESTASFPPATYHLSHVLGPERFQVERVVPWSRLETTARVEARSAGRHWLAVDVGNLSRVERSGAEVFLGDELLDDAPQDRTNYYAVSIPRPETQIVRLRSDQPVPAAINTLLRGLGKPLILNFDRVSSTAHWVRLSDSLRTLPDLRYPKLFDEGTVLVPTLEPEGAAFVFLVDVRLRRRALEEAHEIVVSASGIPFHRVELYPPPGTAKEGHYRSRFSFATHEPLIHRDQTQLAFRHTTADDGPVGVSLRSITVYRQQLEDAPTIDLGRRSDRRFLVEGFHRREKDGGHAWRWTRRRAVLRLLALPRAGPAQLRVRYFTGSRPPLLPAPAPRFTLNGLDLAGRTHSLILGGRPAVEEVLEVPAGLLGRTVSHLEIRSETWVPHEVGAGDDARTLGIMLESVRLDPTGGAGPEA